MGISCSFKHFIDNYGGTPHFIPDDFNSSNLNMMGIEGQIIETTDGFGYIVRLYWDTETNVLWVEYESDNPLSKIPNPKIERI